MDTFVNKKNRQFIVKNTSNGITMEYKTPWNKQTKSHLQLVDSNGKTIEMDGRQVRSLMNVLMKGNRMKRYSSRKKTNSKR